MDPLRIFSMDRTWLLCCETPEEIEMWRSAIIKKAKIRHRHVVKKNDQSLARPQSVIFPRTGGTSAPPPPPPSDDDGEYSDVLSTPPGTPPTSDDEADDGDGAEAVQSDTSNTMAPASSSSNNGQQQSMVHRSSSAPTMTDVREKATPAAESAWKRFTHDASGKYYYYNSQTGKTQWTRPVEYTGDYDDDSDLTSVSSMASSAVTLKTAKSLAAMSIGSSNSMKDGETPKWKKYIDDATGREYWHSAATGETTWQDPGAWKKYVDDSTGRDYWHNKKTGATVWVKPADA